MARYNPKKHHQSKDLNYMFVYSIIDVTQALGICFAIVVGKLLLTKTSPFCFEYFVGL